MAKTPALCRVLYVAPIGNEWSVLERGVYSGLYKLKSQAAAAAEKRATKLRAKGHEVVIRETDKRPGGR